MLGGITEKESKPVASLVVGNSGGFPLSRKVPHGFTRLSNAAIKVNGGNQDISRNPKANNHSIECVDDQNSNVIKGMSQADLIDAMEEVRSLISPKNLQFLQKMPIKSMEAVENDASHGPIADSEAKSIRSTVTNNSIQTKQSFSPHQPLLQKELVKEKQKVESIAHNIFAVSENSLNRKAPSSLSGLAALKCRFDLNGRRIVIMSDSIVSLAEEVEKSGIFLEKKSALIVCDKIIGAVQSLANQSSSDGAFVIFSEDAINAAKDQPQDELRHHQFEGDQPGYNFTEIGEMLRSQFASQRVVAMRILAGILLRRDCVVALLAYSTAYHESRDSSCSSQEQQQLERNYAFEATVTDEIGQRSEVMGTLSSCFERALTSIRVALSANSDSLSQQEHGTAVEDRKLRRLLVHCFLHVLCTPDLPVELPTLLLWALGNTFSSSSSRVRDEDDSIDETLDIAPSFGNTAPLNNPVVVKLSLLRCTSLYLRSPVEEAVVDYLRYQTLLWSCSGSPRLHTPHSRRPDIPYEQYMAECTERSIQFFGQAEEEGEEDGGSGEAQRKDGSPESVMEAFALQCRWSRIEALTSRSSLISMLAYHAVSAAQIASEGVHRVDQDITRPLRTSRSVSPSVTALLLLGREALDLLVTLVRQGSTAVVTQVKKSVLRVGWKDFQSLADIPATSFMEEYSSPAVHLRTLWWKLLNEMVIRDAAVADFLWGTHAEWLASAVMKQMLELQIVAVNEALDSSTGFLEVSRLMSLLQSCVMYGKGFSCVTELLLAFNGQSEALEKVLNNPILFADVISLLEQSAVAAATQLARESEVLSCTAGRYDLSQKVTEAIEVASSVLAFTQEHLVKLSELVKLNGEFSKLSSAILSLLCALLPSTSSPLLDSATTLPMYCYERLKQDLRSSAQCRGVDLSSVIFTFNANLIELQQRTAGGSVSASTMHVSGQCVSLSQACSRLSLFSLPTVDEAVKHAVVECNACSLGSNKFLIAAETVLLWQKFIALVVVICCQNSNITDDCKAQVISFSNACAAGLRTPFLIGHTASGASDSITEDFELCHGFVSDGLIRWHVQRLQCASFLAQIHLSVSTSTLHVLPFLHEYLPRQTSQFFAPQIMKMFSSYLQYIVCHSASINSESVSSLVQQSLAEKYDVLVQSNESVLSIVLNSALGGALEWVSVDKIYAAGPPEKCNASDWMIRAKSVRPGGGGGGLILKRTWAYDVLGGAALSGELLATWLSILHKLAAQDSANESNIANTANMVYSLLKLTVADQAQRWIGGACASSSSSNNEAEAVDYAECSCNTDAIEAFRCLLLLLLRSALRQPEKFSVAFCSVVEEEFAKGPGMLSAMRRAAQLSGKQRTTTSRAVRTSLEGTLDLCDKVLDSSLNQMIDCNVHSVALLAMSGPCMPWSVRLKVWNQLGSMQLVHLLEDAATFDALLPSPPLDKYINEMNKKITGNVPLSCDSAALYVEVADALLSLRDSSDRHFQIVTVAIYQIGLFIFNQIGSDSGEKVVMSSGAHVLSHLRQSISCSLGMNSAGGGGGASWLLHGVLLVGSLIAQQSETETSPLRVIEKLSEYLREISQKKFGEDEAEGGKRRENFPTNLQNISVSTPTSSSGSGNIVPLREFCTL